MGWEDVHNMYFLDCSAGNKPTAFVYIKFDEL